MRFRLLTCPSPEGKRRPGRRGPGHRRGCGEIATRKKAEAERQAQKKEKKKEGRGSRGRGGAEISC